MKDRQNAAAIGGLMLSVVFFLSACALAAEVESVETSAQKWFMEVFAKGFIEGDPNFMDYYSEPIYLVIDDDASALSKDDFAAAIDEKYVQPWLAAGWKTTDVVGTQIETLGSDSVRVTAAWALLDEDGNNVMGCQRPEWHYILVRENSTWRVIADIEGECKE